MKLIYVFGYDQYYPGGGMSDCIGRFKDVQTAKMFLKESKKRNFKSKIGRSINYGYYDIYDMKKNRMIISVENFNIEKL